MFENSIAYTIAPSREGHWRLAELTEQSGFVRTAVYKNVHLLSQQRGALLPFGVVEGAMSLDMIKETLNDIRSFPEIDICYMPMVLVTDKTNMDFIGACINAGFDDILALPCRTTAFTRRIKCQMETQLLYYRTETYFGPDRRRGQVKANGMQRRAGGAGHNFEKITIRRSRRSGIKIISHEKFDADDIMSMFA